MNRAIAFTAAGVELMRRLACDGSLELELTAPARLAGEGVLPMVGPVTDWAGAHFEHGDLLLFVGAAGIAVRAVAPHLRGKNRDPAVLCVDETGRWVIPLLSGHIGGANALAGRIAEMLGAQAVLTTATDTRGVFAFDLWAEEEGYAVANPAAIKHVSAALLAGRPVGLASDFPVDGPLPQGVEAAGEGECGVVISLSDRQVFAQTLHLIPRCLILGVGCRRGVDLAALVAAVLAFCNTHCLPVEAIGRIASVDRKAREPALLALAGCWQVPFICFTPEELDAVPGSFAGSAFVRETVGVDNVCERAAVCAGGELVAPKTTNGPVALAAAQMPWRVFF